MTINSQVSPVGGPDLAELVDVDNGVISREIFVSEQIFKQEVEGLFSRAWLYVGHETQIPEPGDYFASRMGTDAVLMTRDSGGEVHVLLNSCRHRGMKVCRYDSGNTLSVHLSLPRLVLLGRRFDLVSTAGDLFGVPQFHNAYGGKLEKKDWGLVRVGRTETYKGLVFATWDREAPPFEEYVGGFMPWLDNLADSLGGVSGGTEVFGGVLKWRVKANWKFVAENFLGDMYHAATSHASVEAVGIGPAGAGASRHGTDPETLAKRRAIQHSTSFPRPWATARPSSADEQRVAPTFADHPSSPTTSRSSPTASSRYGRRTASRWARTAPRRCSPTCRSTGWASRARSSSPIRCPRGRPRCGAGSWWTRTPAPTRATGCAATTCATRGPAGLTEQDDMENWGYATEASLGAVARRFDYNYAQGLGSTRRRPLPGAVESVHWSTEENARNFYRRWARFAEGTDWKDLMEPWTYPDAAE